VGQVLDDAHRGIVGAPAPTVKPCPIKLCQDAPVERVLVVFPTAWDRRRLADRSAEDAAGAGRFEPVFTEPEDEECPWDLDAPDWLERTAAAHPGVRGVTSSSDYPGATLAGALATRLGLPGSLPETVIRCSHKYYSRLAQRRAVPEAVPPFALADPDHPDRTPEIEFPCFVKPVKGAFSLLARRVDTPEELAAFLRRPAVRDFLDGYVELFNRLVRGLTDLEHDGRWFLVEGLIGGRQATVEGFEQGGEVTILGIVDSSMAPGTTSFSRFDYPSELPEPVQARMADVTRRAIAGLGLTDSLFNVEMTWDPETDRVSIVEVNPRMCGQFADLYEKVDGVDGYEVALAVAAGERPELGRGRGRFAAAASFPLRVFEPVRALAAPGPAEIAAAEALYPGTLIWPECSEGDALADFEAREDGASSRYAVVNLGGAGRDDLTARREAVRERLGYRFAPLNPARR
jgi:hypothetical protein